jgi:hypothetical protein
MVFCLDVSHAVLPHPAGSFAVAKSGNGGNAGGNGAGNHGGGGNSGGGSDQGGAGNHGGGNSHGTGGGASRGGHGPSGHNADKDTIPGVGDNSPKRTGSAQRHAADRTQVLHGPAQGQRPTPLAKARDMRGKPKRAKYSLVASGLTDSDLAKLTARGFRIQARTKGSLSPRTIPLRPPHGLSLDQARRAVRKINPRLWSISTRTTTQMGRRPRAFPRKRLTPRFIHHRATIFMCSC